MPLPAAIDFIRNGMSASASFGVDLTGAGAFSSTPQLLFEPPSIEADVDQYIKNLQGKNTTLQFPTDLPVNHLNIDIFKYNSVTPQEAWDWAKPGSTTPAANSIGKVFKGYSNYEARIAMPLPTTMDPDTLSADFGVDTLFDFWKIISSGQSGVGGSMSQQVRNMTSSAMGISTNRSLAVLFRSPKYKGYKLSWACAPRNQKESTDLRRIIGWFRWGAATEPTGGFAHLTGMGLAAEAALPLSVSLAYKFPSVFRLQYSGKMTEMGENSDQGTFSGMGERWHTTSKWQAFKPAVCRSIAVNYLPGDTHSILENSYPAMVIISMDFLEIEYWTKLDYDQERHGAWPAEPTGTPGPLAGPGPGRPADGSRPTTPLSLP